MTIRSSLTSHVRAALILVLLALELVAELSPPDPATVAQNRSVGE